MEKLIPLINKVQNVLATTNKHNILDLPQIVVVGAQSSGKSSVLQSLVGRDFLPRGTGIVTRRPLILQLIHSPYTQQYGLFSHKPQSPFFDFNHIRQEIQADTQRLVGQNKGVSPEPILLKIFSPSVLDITLVDLPGMTKNPVGDQPRNIEHIIRAMVFDYIKKPNSIILAISPANQDLQNSDALHVAREVDPQGKRTLGVITKLDIMDRGTNALNMLNGSELPLKLGYIGIICRSQEDIQNRKSIRQALEDQQRFFEKNPYYKAISHRMGVGHLSQKLNSLLVAHIKQVYPVLKKDVNSLLKQAQDELIQYGYQIQGHQMQGMIVLNVIQTYIRNFNELLQGNFVKVTDTIQGGARLNYLFFTVFRKVLESIDPLEQYNDQDIRTAIMNTTGPKNILFIPEQAFQILVKSQISKLEEPSLQCMRVVLDELKDLNREIQVPEFERFINLKVAISQVVDKLLQKNCKPTQRLISNFIDVNLAHINTKHPDFIGGAEAIQRAENQCKTEQFLQKQKILPIQKDPQPKIGGVFGWIFQGRKEIPKQPIEEDIQYGNVLGKSIRASSKPTREQKLETFVIKQLIISYFNLVKTNVGDYVPKIVMTYLVNKTVEKLQTELVAKLYNPEKFQFLLTEMSDISLKRQKCVEIIESLKEASSILAEIRDYELEQMENSKVILLTLEGKCFTVSSKIFEISRFLGQMPEPQDVIDIGVLGIDTDTFHCIFQYLKYHNYNLPKNSTKLLQSNILQENTECLWDAQFIQGLNYEKLLKVMIAVNKLDIKPLNNLACMRIACELKNKDLNELEMEYRVSLEEYQKYDEILKLFFSYASDVKESLVSEEDPN